MGKRQIFTKSIKFRKRRLNLNKKTIQKKKIASSLVTHILLYVILLSLSYVVIYPFIYIIINSFKEFSDVYDPTVQWVPKNFTLDNFKGAFKILDYWNSFGNTLFYEIIAALLQFCSCAVTAYGLARFKFKGKGILIFAMMLSIFIPATMTSVPNYVNFKHLDFMGILGFISNKVGVELRPDLIDTPFAFWIPSMLGVGLKGGLFIYIFTQFFKGLPKALEEAAWIDGAGPFTTFLKIIIPSSGASSVVVLLFSIIWHWNDSFLSRTYLSANFPLAVKLADYRNLINTLVSGTATGKLNTESTLLAVCFIYIVPMLLFYLLIQRKFIKSIATSGIVG